MAVVVITGEKGATGRGGGGGGGSERRSRESSHERRGVLPAQCRAGEALEEALICNLLMRDRICGWSRV